MKPQTRGEHPLREAAVAASLIAWRLWTRPPSEWWRDWVVVVAAYWLGSIYRAKSESWPTVTLTAMAYLLGLYALGQFRHTLAVLGLGS